MPKKSKEINPFDGGWNNFGNARDIEENELAEAVNVDCSVKGQISVRKPLDDTSLTYTIHTGSGSGQPYVNGEGLFNFKRDFNLGFSARADTEIFVTALKDDDGGISTDVYVTADAPTDIQALTPIVAYEEAANDVKLAFFVADGNLRISQGALSNANNSKTQFYGGTEKLLQATNVATIFGETNDNIIGPPSNGTFYAGAFDGTTATIDASLHLNVHPVSTFQADAITFDNSGTPPSTYVSELAGYKADPNILGTNADQSHSSGFNSTNDTAQQQGGFVTSLRKRASNGNWSSTYLYGPNETSAGAHFVGVSSYNQGGDKYSQMYFRVLNQPFNLTDKSITIPIWMTNDTYSRLDTIAFEIDIGNNNSNYMTWHIPASEFTAGETWTDIECVYGGHADTTGSAINEANFSQVTVRIKNSVETNWDVTADNVLWGFNYAIGTITLGTPNQGQWIGNYKFYYNFIYDREQQSPTKEFLGQPATGTTYTGDVLNIKTFLKVDAVDDGLWDRMGLLTGSSRRITGANIFFSEIDNQNELVDTDKKFLANLDFDKGIRKTLYDDFVYWSGGSVPNSGRTHPTVTYLSPNTIDTFSTICGYAEGDKIVLARFGCATVLNNRSYIGNVGITIEDASGNFRELKYPDRVYKSVPGQYDVYTINDYIEVAPNDGESVQALASYGDYLLEFKENTLHLINTTQDVEYLEETYSFRGVWHQNAICGVGEGVCWANRYGLFLFDGKEVVNLIKEKIDNEYWYDNVLDPIIGYDPRKNEVFVFMKKAGGLGFRYNFDREHTILIKDSVGGNFGPMMNLVTDKTGNLVTMGKGSVASTIVTKRFDTAAQSSIAITTKDHTLDDPARLKSLKKVYVNYSYNSGTNAPTIQYKKDNGSAVNFTTTTLATTSGAFQTIALTPANSAEANNGRSFQILIYGTPHQSFVLNDINFVYREKSVK